MTLCISAMCEANRLHPYTVYAADFESTGEIARADIGKKMFVSGEARYPVLIAGTVCRAQELVTKINLVIDSCGDVAWRGPLGEAVRQQKEHLADEYINAALGITYREFLDTGKTKLPEDVFREMIYQISRQNLDCSILVNGFYNGAPHLFRIQNEGLVESCENFAAIGSGLYIAESFLFEREQNEYLSLDRTIYHIYEAMRMGARAPGVGSSFEIVVSQWDHEKARVTRNNLSLDYYKFLAMQFEKFGPKKVGDVSYQNGLVPKELVSRKDVLRAKRSASQKSKGQQ